ncbi:hypothetical protein CZ794_10710 [Psychrobacter sp. JB385]|nr:hypothetical protein CZ794_10710 [Psychrobacter sp. JB385]
MASNLIRFMHQNSSTSFTVCRQLIDIIIEHTVIGMVVIKTVGII